MPTRRTPCWGTLHQAPRHRAICSIADIIKLHFWIRAVAALDYFVLTGGIGGTGHIARSTGRQDVCTTILPPGALAGKQAFRKHFVSCNQTRDPFSSCVDLDYTLVQIRGKYFLGPGTENVSPIAQIQITQQSASWGNQPTAEDGFSFRLRWDSFPVATTFTGARLALAGTRRLCTPHMGRYIAPLSHRIGLSNLK